jgi:hypothetical protein
MLNTRRRRLLALLACMLAAGAAVAVIATTGSGSKAKDGTSTYFPQFGITASGASAKALAESSPPQATTPPAAAKRARRRARRRPPLRGHPATATRPGEVFPHPSQGFTPTVSLWPVVSEWWTSDHRSLTVVDSGGDPGHRSTGVLGIFRHDYIRISQDFDIVKVAGAGALKITHAPLGPKVETWAQRRGNIEFEGKNGITGTLHLRDDTVTLTPP